MYNCEIELLLGRKVLVSFKEGINLHLIFFLILSVSYTDIQFVTQHVILLVLYYKVAQKLCSIHQLWKNGHVGQIQEEIRSTPTPKLRQCENGASKGKSSDDEDDGDDVIKKEKRNAMCNGHFEVGCFRIVSCSLTSRAKVCNPFNLAPEQVHHSNY